MADEKIIIDLQFTNNIKSTVSELQKSLSKLDADLNIKADTKQAENDVKGLQDQISKTKDTSIKVNADTSQAEKNIDSLKTKAEGLGNIKGFDNLGSSVGKFGKVLGGLALGGALAGIGAVVTKGAEAEKALQKLSATTGVTGEELEALRKRSFDAFRAGVGEDIASATQALAKADKQLGDFLKPDEVDAFVQKSQAIADLYDKDVSEVIEKSRGFIQNFGLDGQEAGNLIALAMRDGQNQLDDVLDTLEEYPSLLSQTGASAEEFVGILTRGVQQGARDTDRLADAIKEAQIRILAGDFSDAFAGLTEGANETEKQVIDTVNSILTEAQSGDIDIIDAIGLSANKVSEALQAGDIDRALADQINVAVSGTLAEEQGAELYGRIFGAPIDEEQIRQKAQEAGQAVEESFQFQGFEGLQRELEATITEIANSILPAVQPLINTLTETLIPLVGDLFKSLEPLITELFSSIDPLLNVFASVLKPIIQQLGKTLTPVISSLSNLLTQILPPIYSLLIPILELLTPILELLSPIIDLAVELIRIALYPLIGVLKLILPPLTSLIELLVDNLQPVIKIITRGFREVGDTLLRLSGLFDSASQNQFKYNESIIDSIKKQKQLNKQQQDTERSTLELVSQYEKLATQSELTAEDQAKLSDIQVKLAKEYPNVISSTADLETNLNAVKEASKGTAKNIDELRKSYEDLDEQSKQLAKEQISLQIQLAEEEAFDQFENLLGLGGGKLKKLFNDSKNQILKVYDESELNKIGNDLQIDAFNFFEEAGVDTEEQQAYLDGIQKIIELQRSRIPIDESIIELVEDTGEKTKKTKQEFEDYNKTLDATKKKNKETEKSFKELGLDEIIKQLAQLKLAGDEYSKSFYSALSDRALELKRANDDLALSIELVKAELFNKPEVSFIDTTLLSTKEALTLFNKDTKDNLEEVTSYYRDSAGNIIGETTLLRKKQGKDFELIDDSFNSYLDTIVNMPDTFSETVEKLKPIISDLANTFDGEFAIAIQSIVEFFVTFDELLDKSQANNEDYLKAFGDLIGGLSQLTGENVELQRAAAATQVIISTAVAIMNAYKDLPIFAAIPASALLAGIGAAQLATIYGAEEGVIGLNSNYNTKPKGKDNIPFLLAEGESVMTAKETQKNRELFEAIRKDPNNGAEEWFNNNIAPNLTNIGVRLEPVESFNNVNHSNAIVSELKALRRENSSLKDALKDARKIEYYPSERDIVNNINVNLPKNKSYRL